MNYKFWLKISLSIVGRKNIKILFSIWYYDMNTNLLDLNNDI